MRCGRARPASTCVRSPAPGPPAASPMRISMRYSPAGPAQRATAVRQARTAVEESRSWGCGGGSPSRWLCAIPHPAHHLRGGGRRHGARRARAALNASKRQDQAQAHLLPFLMRAMVRAIDDQPNLNAHFDDDAGIIHQHARRAYRHRRADADGLDGAGGQARGGARSLGPRRASSIVWRRRRKPARRHEKNSPARPSPSRRSAPWAAS